MRVVLIPAIEVKKATASSSASVCSSPASKADLVEVRDLSRVRPTDSLVPTWPQVLCDGCSTTVDRWSRMHNTKVWEDDEHYVITRKCFLCIKEEYHLESDGAARSWIYDHCEAATKKKQRVEKFQTAVENVPRFFPAMRGQSKHKIHHFTFENMKDLWSVLGKYILRRREVEEKACVDMEEHGRLTKLLAEAETMEEQQDLMARIELLQRWEPDLAFASRGEAEQERMIRACTYSDCWVELFDDRTGNLKGRLDSYYICKAKTGDHDCMLTTPSKDWDTNGVDPIDARKWTCAGKWCNAKFKAGWGQLVIITRMAADGNLERLYMRAEVPPWSCEDVRAMHLEEVTAKDTDSATDLFKKIKRVVPTQDDLLVPPVWPEDAGRLRFVDRALFDSLPQFQWKQIFNMVGVEAPSGKAKKNKQ